jgi:hypothetical protein
MPPRLSAVGAAFGAGRDVVEELESTESDDDEQAASSAAQASRTVGDFRMGLLACL